MAQSQNFKSTAHGWTGFRSMDELNAFTDHAISRLQAMAALGKAGQKIAAYLGALLACIFMAASIQLSPRPNSPKSPHQRLAVAKAKL